MPLRLVALEEGPDILVDRAVVVIGRHPQCDARLDSIRVSRRHCCMTPDHEEVVVRDLGSTNGIRINGQRVEMGRLRLGDVLTIAHIRYRLDSGQGQEVTLANSCSDVPQEPLDHGLSPVPPAKKPGANGDSVKKDDNALVAAVRDLLPSSMGKQCKIQVIVKMEPDEPSAHEVAQPCQPDSSQ